MGRQYGNTSFEACGGGTSKRLTEPSVSNGSRMVDRESMPLPDTGGNDFTKFCQTCGAKIHRDAVICPKCGVPCSAAGQSGTVQGMAPNEGQDAANSSLMFAGISALCLLVAFFIPGWGFILQIAAYVVAEKGRKYSVKAEDLGWYTGNAKAGRILCIIITVIAALGIVGNILMLILGGALFSLIFH